MFRVLGKYVVAAVMSLAVPSVHALEQVPPDLSGHWASAGLESYGKHFATRAFVFSNEAWRVTYRAYADAQGKQPLFRLEVSGFYVLGQPSAAVAGAFEGIFPATRREVVAESEAGAQMFAAMGCTLAVGKMRALVNDGCGFVPGIMQAMGEYDLVELKEGRLFFGDRAGDLMKARPRMLTPYPLIRAVAAH